MRLLILILSFLLFILSPDKYNYSYILLIFSLFLFAGFISVKNKIKSKEYISFNVLFLVSFFLTTFAYPVFLKPINLDIWLSYIINDDFITKSTALCQLAFSSYVYGLNIRKRNKTIYHHKIIKAHPVNYFISPLIGFGFFMIGFFIVIASDRLVNFDVGWSAFMYTLFILYSTIVIAYSGKDSLLYKKKIFLLISIIAPVTLLLFVIGDRGIALSIIIAVIASFIFYIKRIKVVYLLSAGVISIILFSLIAEFRQEGDILKNIRNETFHTESKWDYFSDLTSISRNIYVGYEYKERNGLYKPERILLLAISPIPFLPSFIANNLLDQPYSYYSSTSTIITSHTSLIKKGESLSGGLGTHSVIDVYMSWGVIGTIMLFLLLGYVVNISYLSMRYNLYYASTYIALTAYAIYIPRSTLFDSYRLIVSLIILLFIFNKVTFIKYRAHNHNYKTLEKHRKI